MIKLFNEKSRIVKNESGAYLWKVGNGYKMSRSARTLLGIDKDTIHNLAIGTTEDDSTLIIKAVASKEEGNCSINKQNVISSKKVVTSLTGFGEKFTLTNEKYEDFFVMTIENNNIAETTTTENNIAKEELVDEMS